MWIKAWMLEYLGSVSLANYLTFLGLSFFICIFIGVLQGKTSVLRGSKVVSVFMVNTQQILVIDCFHFSCLSLLLLVHFGAYFAEFLL